MRQIELPDTGGPWTGKELAERYALDLFTLWKTVTLQSGWDMRTVGKRYIRFDRSVAGYARLSPSLVREFLNYTVTGPAGQPDKLEERVRILDAGRLRISREKRQLAEAIVRYAVDRLEAADAIRTHSCFLLGGDVAYGMAHSEPRPEHRTGEIVRGSDLDIVVVHDGLPETILESLDEALLERKAFLLRQPAYREEVDYLIKDLPRVEEQLRFDVFESMIASKILHEAIFLYGSTALHDRIRAMLDERGLPDRLEQMRVRAEHERAAARKRLLRQDELHGPDASLFRASEEADEFF